jgi:hypothetical protein
MGIASLVYTRWYANKATRVYALGQMGCKE